MFPEAYCGVAWEVVFHPDFDPEFDDLAPAVQDGKADERFERRLDRLKAARRTR